ncbi:MAG: hypothetical protein JW818_05605 [Pirellulales bacterium]|nr:hypothetical protein [Pirellulales bacterium]
MKNLLAALARHQTKLWALSTVVLALLFVNMAAAPKIAPGQWEYKVVAFVARPGEAPDRMQTIFAGILNRESVDGWEFAGRCAHVDGERLTTDYLVLRRRRF